MEHILSGPIGKCTSVQTMNKATSTIIVCIIIYDSTILIPYAYRGRRLGRTIGYIAGIIYGRTCTLHNLPV